VESVALPPDLPPAAARGIDMVVTALHSHLGPSLIGMLLFGSGAEGRLRPVSDVNLLAVVAGLDLAALIPAREALRSAEALARVRVMLLDASEVADAVRAFPDKFDDILHRYTVVWGVHPFPDLRVDRDRLLERLDQVLLNQVLRLRGRALVQGLREEQAVQLLAESAGPLRACAASLSGLTGVRRPPKEALQAFVAVQAVAFEPLLGLLSKARESSQLPPGQAAPALEACIGLTQALRRAVLEAKA
jgi:predicted nucleotidyltransferase